jgi:hypothetical protein
VCRVYPTCDDGRIGRSPNATSSTKVELLELPILGRQSYLKKGPMVMVNDSKAQSASPEPEQPLKRDSRLVLVVPRLTSAILKALKAQQNEPKGVIVNRLLEAEGLRVLGKEQIEGLRALGKKRIETLRVLGKEQLGRIKHQSGKPKN